MRAGRRTWGCSAGRDGVTCMTTRSGHDDSTSPARPGNEPCAACASSAYRTGGFAIGPTVDRSFYSPQAPADTHVGPQSPSASPAAVTAFPTDVFDAGDAVQTCSDVYVALFVALRPLVRRVAVHAVVRRTATGSHAESFGVYLVDYDGNEHAFLDFHLAPSAAYAALRIGQVYRLGVEFGNFRIPKDRMA